MQAPGSLFSGGLHALARAWRGVHAGRRGEARSLLGADDWEEIAAALRQRPGRVAAARLRHPGAGNSPLRGRGLDYAQSRAYQAGDDMRAMHWPLLARTGRPYVREYEEDHAAPWHALVDAHGGMLFGTRMRTKAEQAARAATLAAGLQALASPQSSVSLAIWSEQGVQARDFGRGGAATRSMAQWLMQQRIAPLDVAAAAAEPSLPALQGWARRLARHRPTPARIVVCSDFAWLDDAARLALWPLVAKSQLLCLHVLDPVEVALPDLADALFVDAHSGGEGWLESGPHVRQAFARLAEQRRARLTADLRGLRAGVAQLHTPATAVELSRRLRDLLR